MDREVLKKLQETISPKWRESISESLSLSNKIVKDSNISQETINALKQSVLGSQYDLIETQNLRKVIEEVVGNKWAIHNKLMTEMATNLSVSQAESYLEQWQSLESFKALSRLEDFPFNNTESYSKKEFLGSKANTTVQELDSKISKNIKSINSFDELADKEKEDYLNLYANYFLPVILNYCITVVFYKTFLDEKFSLSNYNFTIANNKIKSYINDYKFNPYSLVQNYLLAEASKSFLENIFGN